jgi:thiol-disulfide isomerase/thioredoxin
MSITREAIVEPRTPTPRGVMRANRMPALVLSAAAVTAGCAAPTTGPAGAAPGNAMTAAPGAAMTAAAGPAKLAFKATTLDGAAFDGASLGGRPAVLWFWAAWCSVCAGEAPALAKVAAANPGVQFIGVTSQPAQAFVTASGAVRVVPGAMSEQVLAQQVAALGAP